GAELRFTTDSTEPTVTSPIVPVDGIEITANTTIKVIATMTGMTNSAVQSFSYTVAQTKVAKPTATPAAGEVEKDQVVTVTTPTQGATLHYTTDGSVPTAASDVFPQNGVTISTPKTLKVIGIKQGLTNSDVSEFAYTIKAAPTQVAAPTSSVSGTVAKGSQAVLATTTPGAEIYYTTDGSVPTAQSTKYTAAITLAQSTTIKAIAVKSGITNSEITTVAINVKSDVPSSNIPSSEVAKNTQIILTAAQGATIYYTTDGTTPTTQSLQYTQAITINAVTTIRAIAVEQGLVSSDELALNYTLPTNGLTIMDIQGQSHVSAYLDKVVTDVAGVVIYVDGTGKFFMQDVNGDNNIKTSDAIAVFKSNHGVAVGDLVKVSGKVVEFTNPGYDERFTSDLKETQIAAQTISKVGSASLPAPIKVGEGGRAPVTTQIDDDAFGSFDPETDALDWYESLEGMRVTLTNPLLIAPQRYGELNVVLDKGANNPDLTVQKTVRISKGDFNPERFFILINNKNYVAKAGDWLNGTVTGVVSYTFSNYKILVKEPNLPALVDGGVTPESTTITKHNDKLTVATFNVENYAANATSAKTTGLAKAITTGLGSPDIVSLAEIQDDNGASPGGTDATQTYQKLIDAIKAQGGPTYTFVNINPENNKDGGEPEGNIRVGFLYNESRVTLKGGIPAGDFNDSVGYANGNVTYNPGRIDPTNEAFESSRKPLVGQFVFKGKDVIVIANHMNSKRGDEPLFGIKQPPVNKSEIQRHKQATLLNAFVKDVLAKNPTANIVVAGDINDFEFSDTVNIIKGNELVNMVDTVPVAERFGYNYQGNAQILDHIFVSKNLAYGTQIDMVHTNSAFMEQHGRTSDHDPSVIQISFTAPPPPVPTNTVTVIGTTAKQFVINKANLNYAFEASTNIPKVVVNQPSTLQGDGLKNKTIVIDLPNENDTVNINLLASEVTIVIIKGKVTTR
ncbi:MAG: chitobiase/beta-hexosaminidase C-terminal domain-containing protein, partial [Bacilli bacterium]